MPEARACAPFNFLHNGDTAMNEDTTHDEYEDDDYIEYEGNFYECSGQFAPDDEDEGTIRKHIKRRKPNR